MDVTTPANMAHLTEVGQRAGELEARFAQLEALLPQEVRRLAEAPMRGVLLLVAGLICFVVANVVGVLG